MRRSDTVGQIKARLRVLASKEKAKASEWFFKTGPGEYGEGDVFVGVTVPTLRKVAKDQQDLSHSGVATLLKSKIHEERLLALLIWVLQYKRGDDAVRKRIYTSYLENTRHINNWDLVDTSADHIVGAYLADKSKRPIHELSKSSGLWERRIAMLATFHYMKAGEFDVALRVARTLVTDTEDLIHKAVGWMLREIGKRDRKTEETFLAKHYQKMPRTMLRYAIERFPESRRQQYLKGRI